jgi:hypothetical protein
MKSRDQIVHGGGWLVRRTTRKPWARVFTFLSTVWLSVSVCASIPLLDHFPMPWSVLEWLCVLLILPEPVLIMLTVGFWFGEKPRTIVEKRPNPDYDIRNLY